MKIKTKKHQTYLGAIKNVNPKVVKSKLVPGKITLDLEIETEKIVFFFGFDRAATQKIIEAFNNPQE